MTVGLFKQIMEENHILDDVTMLSNSGWECGPSEMDGIYYNPSEKTVTFTQAGTFDDLEFDDDHFELLHGYNKLCKKCKFLAKYGQCKARIELPGIPYVVYENIVECHKFKEKRGLIMGLMSRLGYIRKEEHIAICLRWYRGGYEDGKNEIILRRTTPNDICKACGLPPLQ